MPAIGDGIRRVEQLFRDDWTTSAWTSTSRSPSPARCTGTPPLAATYRRILEEAEAASRDRDAQLDAAHDCWYRGFVAEEFVAFQEREWLDSSGERHAGLLSEDDLRDWAPTWEEPLSVNYHGYEVFKAGPWSQAPVLLQQLRLLEGFDLDAMARRARTGCTRSPNARSSPSPIAKPGTATRTSPTCRSPTLLSREYAEERRELLGEEASAELRPGSPGGYVPRLAGAGRRRTDRARRR